MVSSVEDINTYLKKALKITDRNKKVLYLMSIAQLLQVEIQMESVVPSDTG